MFESDNFTPHLAAVYDAQVRNTIPYYDAIHEETINVIKARHVEPKTWLDTGCGTGTLVQKARAAFPNTQFVVADPSQQMLNIAKKKLASSGDSRVQFLEPLATQNLPQREEKFDVVSAVQSHHYLLRGERIKATAICFDLLAPRGIYVTFENIRPLTTVGIAIGKENWKHFQLARGRDLATVEKHLRRFDAEYHPITIEEHLSLLRKTGFSTIEMLWYSYLQAGFYCIK